MDQFNFDVVSSNIKRAIDNIPSQLAEIVATDSQNNFDSEGFGGSSWMPTKQTNQILNKTGKLKKSALDSKRNGRKINNGFVLVVDSLYSGYHQDGIGKLPVRQFIGITNELNRLIEKKITDMIDQAFR